MFFWKAGDAGCQHRCCKHKLLSCWPTFVSRTPRRSPWQAESLKYSRNSPSMDTEGYYHKDYLPGCVSSSVFYLQTEPEYRPVVLNVCAAGLVDEGLLSTRKIKHAPAWSLKIDICDKNFTVILVLHNNWHYSNSSATIAYSPLIRNRPHRVRRGQQFMLYSLPR